MGLGSTCSRCFAQATRRVGIAGGGVDGVTASVGAAGIGMEVAAGSVGIGVGTCCLSSSTFVGHKEAASQRYSPGIPYSHSLWGSLTYYRPS